MNAVIDISGDMSSGDMNKKLENWRNELKTKGYDARASSLSENETKLVAISEDKSSPDFECLTLLVYQKDDRVKMRVRSTRQSSDDKSAFSYIVSKCEAEKMNRQIEAEKRKCWVLIAVELAKSKYMEILYSCRDGIKLPSFFSYLL